MKCYQCGCLLSEKDFCTNCGADVSLFKRIMQISNLFYNEGLEKADVRDLSGAIVSLRQSLKFNKNNVEARNLLGLVYFERGEAVAALSEWVISKNLRSKKNIADDYINAIQTNPTRLDTINQTIKKYNQALSYCYQDSLDLAIIQLKKVLSLNSNFVQAHQLLALLYINGEEWEKAKRELEKCCKIDANNTSTLRFMKEIDAVLEMDEEKNVQGKRKKGNDDILKYQSGNETIIQPLNAGEPAGFSTILNIVIGAVIGLALAWFLIVPARVQSAKSDISDQLRAVSEESDVKTSSIAELELRVEALQGENTTLQENLDQYEGTDGTMQANDDLIQATMAYMSTPDDVEKVSVYLAKIDADYVADDASEAFSGLYNFLMETIGPKMGASLYQSGLASYKQGDYTNAIKDLAQAVEFDATNGDALYNLANAYKENGNDDKAKETYAKVVELFPGTEKASKSQNLYDELNDGAEQ